MRKVDVLSSRWKAPSVPPSMGFYMVKSWWREPYAVMEKEQRKTYPQ